MNKKIGLGIPTINRADLLNQALEVYKNTWSGSDVYIIDNGNQDIRTTSPNQHIIKTEKNLGVSGSWNLLCDILFAKGYTHVALLNDDIVLDKNVDEIGDFINNNPSDFYVGTLTWCAFIIPLTTWQIIGRFDEIYYPAYYEDNDYAYRLHINNSKYTVTPFLNPKIYRNSQTIAKNPELNKSQKNQENYIKKWGGTPGNEKYLIPYTENKIEVITVATEIKKSKESKKVNTIFSSGFNYKTKVFEGKLKKLTYDNPEYNPLIEQPSFNYLNKKYESKIPLKIFQTWSTKKLLPKMQDCVNELKNLNPEFEYYLYDDLECEKFIGDNFNDDVLNAYKKLIPGAYKADLWRYCVLYINGGIYLDIKYKPFKGFKLIELTEKEHFVLDLNESNNGIYNGLMVCEPFDVKLLNAINNVVINVQNNFYGETPLHTTGPLLLKTIFSGNQNIDLTFTHKNGLFGILNKNKSFILYNYPEYRTEQSEYFKDTKKLYYGNSWGNRNIFNDIT